ncbi:hypothetical protein N9E97_03195, partial [Planktomarina sp.]|nr:hypothetical protein [Planktomarina sp.]
MPTYKYFLNDEGTLFTQTWSDSGWFPGSTGYTFNSSQPNASVPSGYYEVLSSVRTEYQSILDKIGSVNSYETEFNGRYVKADPITINETVSGSFGSSTDVDIFQFNVDVPQKIDVSFAYMPSAGLGALSHSGDSQVGYAVVVLFHDQDGDGILEQDERDPYLAKALTSHTNQTINLGDTGEYFLALTSAAITGSGPYLKHSSDDYRFIIETDAPPPMMTYSVPTNGMGITHTGSGATVNANVDVSTSSDGIIVNNTGTGSTTITATGTVKGGVGEADQTRNIDGIYANNSATATNLSITAKDVTGLNSGIEAVNNGTGFLAISLSGDVVSTSTATSADTNSHGIYAYGHGTDVTVFTTGDITSNDRGITALNAGNGKTSVSSEGVIQALGYRAQDGNGNGIYVINRPDSSTTDIVVNANTVSAWFAGIATVNYGSGSITITATGAVKGGVSRMEDVSKADINPPGISAANVIAGTDINITANDVSGQGRGIFARNLGTGKTEISVSGKIVGSGSDAEGIHTVGSESTITVLTSSTVSGTTEGIKTDSKADTVTVNGSVTGLNGTAILLGGGNDTVNLGTTATITGTIDGGTGSDTANFSVSKSAVDTFTYDDTTKTAVVTVDSTVTTFKDFESFKFADVSSGMTAEEAVSTFAVSDSPAKSIGSLADQTVAAGVALNLSEILSSKAADGSSYSWINVYDATGGNNFVKNGVEIDASAGAWVSANDLANTVIKGDNQASEQTLYLQTYEGGTFSAWDSLVLTTTGSVVAVAQPIGSLADQTVAAGSSVNLSEILSSTNADGGSHSWFQVYDATGGNNFVKNGVEIDASVVAGDSFGTWVSSSDLANTTIKADNQASEQTLWLRTFEGGIYSDYDSLTFTTTGSAAAVAQPVGSIADQTVAAGSSVNLSEILSSTNADGGSYSWFNVYDATGGNNFVKNGVEIDASAGSWVS